MALSLSKESLNTEKAGQWFDRLQSLQITRRLGLMAMIAVAVAAGLFVFFWSQKPGMVPLYTGLDQKATAEATDLLRGSNTAEIRLEDRVYTLRLTRAGKLILTK